MWIVAIVLAGVIVLHVMPDSASAHHASRLVR